MGSSDRTNINTSSMAGDHLFEAIYLPANSFFNKEIEKLWDSQTKIFSDNFQL
jgi:hypothetical protein